MVLELMRLTAAGGQVEENGPGYWRLTVPSGKSGQYRLAQLDDYEGLPRRQFNWQAPLRFELQARASHAGIIPGTWGFGLWNDPFSLALFNGTEAIRLPALPNTAWFFFASPPNYLSLRDDLPARGALAGTFHSPRLPAWLLALAAPALPLLAFPPLVRWLRRPARRFVRQATAQFSVDVSAWHTYRLDWQAKKVLLAIDSQPVLETEIAPAGPLGLVIWIDNQFAALPPDGRPRWGTLANPEPAWIEIRELAITGL